MKDDRIILYPSVCSVKSEIAKEDKTASLGSLYSHISYSCTKFFDIKLCRILRGRVRGAVNHCVAICQNYVEGFAAPVSRQNRKMTSFDFHA